MAEVAVQNGCIVHNIGLLYVHNCCVQVERLWPFLVSASNAWPLQLKVHLSFALLCIGPSGILDIEELQLQLWVNPRSALGTPVPVGR